MNTLKAYSLITDLGSTTTKAVLINNLDARILGIAHAATTVEAPVNDVMIGVYNAVKELESITRLPLLEKDCTPGKPRFLESISYHSTSSAGGGLQILVIGLTLFDSASSARRAAYGAGGLIVGLFAINDGLSASQQMLNMRTMRPDMILISGGTDDGALGGVLRMVEILRIARPLQKYESSSRIPTIYAGNQAAVPIIKNMISEDFELYCLPNLRPSLTQENLKPTQEKVQELFMQRVMERAPGYQKLKNLVNSEILPTPMGVLKAIEKMPDGNVLLFDVGGATTDVFSRINGHLQRTVSANLGMSYSMQNVLKESGIQRIMAYLPPRLEEGEVRNYIGNKSLFPTLKPQSADEYRIEHAIAKAAIQKAFVQHHEMHFNTEKIGYLDRVKEKEDDRFREKFSYIADEKKYSFYSHEIDTLIGAGGVFAHAQNPNEAIDILISGYQPTGIVKLMIDRYFISPHLGVLSAENQSLSQTLLNTECLLPLAMYIRPRFAQKQKKGILKISGDLDGNSELEIMPDAFIYLPAKAGRKLQISPLKNCFLAGNSQSRALETDLPVIIDTRMDRAVFNPAVASQLKLGSDQTEKTVFQNHTVPESGEFCHDIELPYKGEILVSEGQMLLPSDLVGVNQFEPARLFVIPVFSGNHELSIQQKQEHTLVQIGDQINFDQALTKPMDLPGLRHAFLSPVRGKVEYIEYAAGIIIASEIQDYDMKLHRIDIARELGIKANRAKSYLLKRPGEFVYMGESLARTIQKNKGMRLAKAPSTGEVLSFDAKTGIMELQYRGRPQEFFAFVKGRVESLVASRSARILFSATRLEASIGWGRKQYGILSWHDALPRVVNDDEILALSFVPSEQDFKQLLSLRPKALIIPSLEAAWLPAFLGEEQGVINTGLEASPCTLLLMQGFGKMPYSKVQEEFLSKHAGEKCYLDPHTRIRAGFARAGIYIQTD